MRPLHNRRQTPRWPVKLFVKCRWAQKQKKVESDMWVRDLNERGMKLEYSNTDNLPWANSLKTPLETQKKLDFKRGIPITVEDLYYDEEGSHGVKGKVCWAKSRSTSNHWEIGVEFDKRSKSANKKQKAFNEFVDIVKDSPSEEE